MIYKLNQNNYYSIKKLIKNSTQDLSILSVINGIMPGEIFVDCETNPTSVLVKTSECNVLAGNPNNDEFNSGVKDELDFFDSFILDTEEWAFKISEFHKNRFIRKYKRRHYILSNLKYNDYKQKAIDGYLLEKIDANYISKCNLKNSSKIMDWINEWGSIDNFNKYGIGFMIRNEETIVSWSLTDCTYDKRTAIGIHCDFNYRKNGFGAITAAATVDYCLCSGIKEIDWLCVDTNIGSIKIAEKLGFVMKEEYYSFSSYPPIENEEDLTLEQWEEWALYYEKVIEEEPRLLWECAVCWMRAYNVTGLINILDKQIARGWKWTVTDLSQFYFCLRFSNNIKWVEYLNYLETIWV